MKKPLRASFTALLLTILVFMLAGSKPLQTLESFETTTLESASSEATIYVDPSTTIAEVNQKFSVNISISNVTDLYGWEFKLKWTSTLLEATNITEGNFLKSQGDTLFVININNTEGYLRAACTLIGSIPGANGSGTLATVEFYVKSSGECILDLYDTKLVNSTEQPIEHVAIDGYFDNTPLTPVGGVWVPVDKFGLLVPYIGLALAIVSSVVVTVVFIKRKNRKR